MNKGEGSFHLTYTKQVRKEVQIRTVLQGFKRGKVGEGVGSNLYWTQETLCKCP